MVPYYPMSANIHEPNNSSTLSVVAMLCSHLGVSVKPDELYWRHGRKAGWTFEGALDVLAKELGTKFFILSSYTGNLDQVAIQVSQGRKVALFGTFEPVLGAILVVGLKGADFVVNDPRGVWLGDYSYNVAESGQNVVYSRAKLQKAVGRSGEVWWTTAFR